MNGTDRIKIKSIGLPSLTKSLILNNFLKSIIYYEKENKAGRKWYLLLPLFFISK